VSQKNYHQDPYIWYCKICHEEYGTIY